MAERVADLSELRYRHARAHLARECDCALWYVPTKVAVHEFAYRQGYQRRHHPRLKR